MAARQLARLASDISRTAGTWGRTSGSDDYAMLDETICDGAGTQLQTPTTVATHTVEMKFGANWNDAALARPSDNTSALLEIVLRANVGAVTFTIYLVENETVRDTWNLGSITDTTYKRYRRRINSTVIDAITDFTNLRLRIDTAVGTSGRSGVFSYAHLSMGSVTGPQRGRYTLDFTGLSEMPRCWAADGIAVIQPVPSISGGKMSVTTNGLIASCHALDLIADSFASVRCASGIDASVLGLGCYVRLNPTWVTAGGVGDSWRYNMVNNTASSQHEIELDGVDDDVFDTVAYASVPNLVAGDLYETRSVGNVHSGRKNNVEILSGTHNTITDPGLQGVVFSLAAGTEIAVDRFVMGSVGDPVAGRGFSPSIGMGL